MAEMNEKGIPAGAPSLPPAADSPVTENGPAPQGQPAPQRALQGQRSEDLFPAGGIFPQALNDTVPPSAGLPIRSAHWSIGWSDLMMTMCMLFLVLYVQQTSQKSFQREAGGEVVAGSEIPVQKAPDNPWPLMPITPSISDKPGDLLRRLEPAPPTPQELDERLMQATPGRSPVLPTVPPLPAAAPAARDVSGVLASLREEIRGITTPPPLELPRPLAGAAALAEPQPGSIASVYDLSHRALDDESRRHLASVELVPERTVRIVLTADLLFPSGSTQLAEPAREVLRKVARIIRETPYRVHVEGHSDNQPIRSPQFPSNWELSLARAGQVARTLIEEMGLPGNRFVVSGHADNHPRQSNNDAVGRAANRRVEILITREPATGGAGDSNPSSG